MKHADDGAVPWRQGGDFWVIFDSRGLTLIVYYFIARQSIQPIKKNDRHPALTQPVAPEILASFCARHNISKREREIIELVIRGKSNQQIEEALFISLRTVKNHLYNIYQKVGIKSRLQLLYKIQRWQA